MLSYIVPAAKMYVDELHFRPNKCTMSVSTLIIYWFFITVNKYYLLMRLLYLFLVFTGTNLLYLIR